jgi:hypothetical protein
MNYVKEGWVKIKKEIDNIDDIYLFDETKKLLLNEFYYQNYFGKAKNRTLIKENIKLYKSIYHHTEILETVMKEYKRYKGSYNFMYRLKFIVELDCNIDKLKCECGSSYTWNTYCRKCPDYHKTWLGKKHTKESKLKQRLSTLNYLSTTVGQITPRYNVDSIPIIEEYGKKYGYNFQHAENGGEYYIKELGYFVDGYDKEKNVVIEIDEPHHFNTDGSLKQKDIDREYQIKKLLKCEFIRIKYDR